MFTALGMYSENFEKPFLECTSEFYATEGVKYLQQSDIPDYLKHVEVLINLLYFPLHFVHTKFRYTYAIGGISHELCRQGCKKNMKGVFYIWKLTLGSRL